MTFNKSGTFIYTPDISCHIMLQSGKVLDVSPDIMNFTVSRQINAVSQLNMTLSNEGRKYNRTINTMDRITVFLKRTSWVQVFTGYITYAPIETLVPTPINIAADCTLRILQNTYWDDTLIDFQSILLNYMDGTIASSDQLLNDGGVGQAIVNLLYLVCGWNPNRIHIQGIPTNFVQFASYVYTQMTTNQGNNLPQDTVQVIASLISAAGYSSGHVHVTNPTSTTLTHTVSAGGAPAGTGFSIQQAKPLDLSIPIDTTRSDNRTSPTANALDPVTDQSLVSKDIYWCCLPFHYTTFGEKATTASGKKAAKDKMDTARNWLAKDYGNNSNDGKLLYISVPENNRSVIVRATSLIRSIKPEQGSFIIGRDNYKTINYKADIPNTDWANINYCQLHPAVIAYLSNTIDDPTKYNNSTHVSPIGITINWADTTKIKTPGALTAQDQAAAATVNAITGGNSGINLSTTRPIDNVVAAAVSQIGATYPNPDNGHTPREVPGTATKVGQFDCSGLTQWAYSTVGIRIGGNTWTQWGAGNSSDNATHGQLIPSNEKPQKGDILFWNVASDGGKPPQHVTMLSQNFDSRGKGKHVHANNASKGSELNQDEIDWAWIKNGGEYPGWGMKYMGARRPITLHHGWGTSPTQSFSNATTTSSGAGSINVTSAWNTLFNPPQYDPRSSVIVGSSRAFILDNPAMADLQQIIGAGMRSFMSAPNGDFVAWFPDYYGVYGTDPVLDISPVEIIDFQIYHDDNQLVTHYGVVGDTAGVGQGVSFADYISTNGIVSIQDGTTMQILFHANGSGVQLAEKALNFLNKYGMRPMVSEQSMIHSHEMEYMYALYGFMNQWVRQYVTTVTLTFMPELYPGMRVSMKLDNESGVTESYQFYCTSVTHNGDRDGGFTTHATFTAPMLGNKILDYGLNLLS